MPITHAFISAKPASADLTLVDGPRWNAAHVVSITDADVAVGAAIAEGKLALNFPTHASVTIGAPANGLSVLGQVVSLGLASVATAGALSAADWATFNGKQAALTFPLDPSLGGTGVNNGAFDLTVPATGTAALLGIANVFTTTQTIQTGADAAIGLIVKGNSATQTGNLQEWQSNLGTILGGVSPKGVPFAYGAAGITTSIAFGIGAGGTGTGANNVAIGLSAMLNATNGGSNVCIGAQAGRLLTTGVENFFLGVNCGNGSGTLTASFNVGIGSGVFQGNNFSGGSNISIGRNSGKVLSTGGSNVFIGANVGTSVTTGASNTIIGVQAGQTLVGGAANIFIGASAGWFQTGSNILIIDSTKRADAATEVVNAYLYGNMAPGGYLANNVGTTTTNAVKEVFRIQAYVSTAATGAAAGFGPAYTLYAETATDGTYQQQGQIAGSWIDATNATRKAKLSFSAFDTAARLGFEIEASGAAAMLAFYGGTTVLRGAALTAADAGVVNSGDATTDGVINNMRIRINELEARLGSATGVNLFA